MDKPTVSFFCPAYNDEGNIRGTVENVVSTLEKYSSYYDVTIVEDGSPDNTAEVCDALSEEYPHVSVIHNSGNLGYGGALKVGFNAAKKYEIATYTDGDGQYDFREFKLLLDAWDGECVVSAYRVNRADNAARVLQTRVYGVLLRVLFNLKLKDVNCSMKLFPKAALDGIEIHSDSAFIDAEMLIKLSRLGYRIKQVGVHHLPRLHGAASGAKPAVVLTTIKDMLRLFFGKNL
ncbi:MAG: glycosyltransferase family 2 protein [Candidatus Fermentibacteraceae bacterium]|nr:glycosyltransferase family 2 protein [Candidatus Fermentibacteraceae bacterium]